MRKKKTTSGFLLSLITMIQVMSLWMFGLLFAVVLPKTKTVPYILCYVYYGIAIGLI